MAIAWKLKAILYFNFIRPPMKKLMIAAAIVTTCIAPLADANTVTIDHTWYGTETGTFVFTATPESNGLINFADLTALSYLNSEGQTFNLSGLNSFGTFDTNTNIWSSNAPDWYGTKDAFACSNANFGNFSWCFANVSYEQPQSYTVVSDVGGSTVPEPAGMALLGLGLAGLIFSRRRAK